MSMFWHIYIYIYYVHKHFFFPTSLIDISFLIHTFGHVLLQIKIWEDRKLQPLLVLRPYDGLPVYSSTFVTAPNRPDHIILVTVVCDHLIYLHCIIRCSAWASSALMVRAMHLQMYIEV